MKKIVFLMAFILAALVGVGQDTISFIKIGTQNDEAGVRIKQYSDSSFVILVNSGNDQAQTNSNIELLTVDTSGFVINSISIGTIRSERASNFALVGESAIITGVSNGYSELYEGIIYFVDLDGTLKSEHHESIANLWSTYTTLSVKGDTCLAVLEVIGSDVYEPVIQIFSVDGESLDQVILSNTEGFHFKQILPVQNGYLCVGSIGSDSSNAFLVRYDLSFEQQWISVFSTSGKDEFIGVTELKDSSIIVVGNSDGFFLSDQDIVVLKYDKNGQPLDTLFQGYDINADNKDDAVFSVFSKNDTIYSTGYTRTYGFGGSEAFMTRLDKDINPISGSGTFGTTGNEQSNDIISFKSGVVGVGFSENNTQGLRDIVFWKRSKFTANLTELVISDVSYSVSNTILEVKEENPLNFRNLKIIQTGNHFKVESSSDELISVEVFDLKGTKCLDFRGYNNQGFSIFSTGVYIIRVGLENEVIVKKVVVL